MFAAACQTPNETLPGDGLPGVAGPVEGQKALVTWIYDGDTIEVQTDNGEMDVRLMGINAPDDGECFYNEATDFLIDTVKTEEVALQVVGTDQFGRTLAHVFLHADAHINLQLVEGGMAITTTPDQNDAYGTALLGAEETAWRDRVGLWAEDACGSSSPLPDIVIDSVEPNPAGPDDEVLEDETVVIVNEGSKPENLTGWVLRDESSRHRYHFPNGTRLEPGGTLTITSADAGWDPGETPVWNNGGDMAMLLDKHGRVVDRIRY